MKRPIPIDEEYKFDGGLIISSTNLNGIITYANRKFCEIAGYSKDELIGKNHNIIRHPDMPKATFKELWDTLHKGKDWSGIIKNLRKDGRYYWAYSYITPIIENNNIIGYSATMRPVFSTEVEAIKPVYKEMLEKEQQKGVQSTNLDLKQMIDSLEI